jgi:hypothetical protein
MKRTKPVELQPGQAYSLQEIAQAVGFPFVAFDTFLETEELYIGKVRATSMNWQGKRPPVILSLRSQRAQDTKERYRLVRAYRSEGTGMNGTA